MSSARETLCPAPGPCEVGATWLGAGPRLLLLPGLSSISTRGKMRALQERLADAFETVAVDWPGFGGRPRPKRDWTPADMDDFLTGLIVDLAPACVVAAGHAAGYALRHAARDPTVALPHVLVEPTWRGPTAMIPPRRSRRPQLSCPAVTMHKR